MTRIPTWGAALLALALILLAPGIALAQAVPATGASLAPLLALIPGGAVWVPVAIAAASLLDAVLPHPATGSPLAIPRAMISLLAGNVGKAANAQGNTLGAALAGNLGSALAAAGLKVVPADAPAPQTVTVDAGGNINPDAASPAQ